MKQWVVFVFLFRFSLLYSQTEKDTITMENNPCHAFQKQHAKYKKPFSYPFLREGDVAWEKRVWRDIDLR